MGGLVGAAPIVAAGPVAVHDPGQEPAPGLAVGGALERRVVGLLGDPRRRPDRRTGRGGSCGRRGCRSAGRWRPEVGGRSGIRLDAVPVEHEAKPVDAASPHLAKVGSGRAPGFPSRPRTAARRWRRPGRRRRRRRPRPRPSARPARRITARVRRSRFKAPAATIATRAAISARLGPAPALSLTTEARPRRWTPLAAPGFAATRRSRCGRGRRPQGGGGGDLGQKLAVGGRRQLGPESCSAKAPAGRPEPCRRRGPDRRRHSEGVGYIDRPQEDWPPRLSLTPRTQLSLPSSKSGDGDSDAQIEPCSSPQPSPYSDPARGP